MQYSFDMNNIIQTAFLLRVHIDEIIEASKNVSFTSTSNIDVNISHNLADSYKRAFCYLATDNVGVAVYCDGTPTEFQQIYILSFAYLAGKPNATSNINRVKTHINAFIIRKQAIRVAEDNIRAYIGTIEREYAAMAVLTLNIQDMQTVFKKICKRLKIKYEHPADLHEFTFKGITIGNDVEGYLRYKTVTVKTNDDLTIKEIIYGFNGFTYSTLWNLSMIGHMHPHISIHNICYGNRAGDYTMYKEAGAYDFLVLLIKESLETYDTRNPYEHLSNIIRRVEVLESVVQMGEVQENGVTITQSTNPKRYAELLLRKIKRCPHCNYMLMANPIDPHASISCTNTQCHANPNATLNCSGCNQPLTRGSWSQANRRYNYECHSPRDTCIESVEYKKYMACKKKIMAVINRYKVKHFILGKFTDKTGVERNAMLHDGVYVPCPYCGEPLGNDFSCVSSDRSSPCRRYRWYYIEEDAHAVNKIVEEYIATEDNTLPEIPDNIFLLVPDSGTSIIGRLLGKEYVKTHPTVVLRELRYDSSYAYHYNTGDLVFRYKEFYTEYIRAGNPRIPHADEYYLRQHNIRIE